MPVFIKFRFSTSFYKLRHSKSDIVVKINRNIVKYVEGDINIMNKLFRGYSEDEVIEVRGKIKRLEIRRKEFNELKEKLEEEFKFEIVGYIIDDILDYEDYHHFCLMVNMAVINHRLTAEEGKKLKLGIKKLFKIDSEYDRLDKAKYIKEVTDFDLWYETYSTKELVDLKKHLSENDFELLKKLGIEVKDKIYTEQELEYLDMDLIAYYINEEDMDEEEIKESKDLPESVTREEFNELLEKVNNISIKYNF